MRTYGRKRKRGGSCSRRRPTSLFEPIDTIRGRQLFQEHLLTAPSGVLEPIASPDALTAEDVVNDNKVLSVAAASLRVRATGSPRAVTPKLPAGGRSQPRLAPRLPRDTHRSHAPLKGFKASAIARARRRNLSFRSMTALLRDLLRGRSSPALRRIRREADPASAGQRWSPDIDRRYVARMHSASAGACVAAGKGSAEFQFIGWADSTMVKLVQHLLSLGADPSETDQDGCSAFVLACFYRKGERLLRMMLDAGADANRHTFRSRSPVDIASEVGNAEVLQLLLERGGLPRFYPWGSGAASEPTEQKSARKRGKGTISDLAKAYGFERIAHETLQKGLYEAVKNAATEKVRTICQHLKSVDFIHPEVGATPLYAAVREIGTPLPLIQTLLEHGADPNAVDAESKTPMCVYLLLRGARKKTRQAVSMLMRHGLNAHASVGGQDEDSKGTLLDFAESVSPELRPLLLQTTRQVAH